MDKVHKPSDSECYTVGRTLEIAIAFCRFVVCKVVVTTAFTSVENLGLSGAGISPAYSYKIRLQEVGSVPPL
jgi:hypothetical protein